MLEIVAQELDFLWRKEACARLTYYILPGTTTGTHYTHTYYYYMYLAPVRYTTHTYKYYYYTSTGEHSTNT